jgi:asparagine synthase (glutamine-hydrolysing)
MCGIAGFLGQGGRGDIERMTARLHHRGPDAGGFFEKPGLFLGHRRLSIVDLAGGAQPMVSADGRDVLVYNGEIYNHREIRRELIECGRVFSTDHSDTEVLLQGWQEWQYDLLPRLNGMWAFALYRAGTGELVLARDRFGKKPLYYFARGGTFAFASELTALLEHPQAPRSESALARVKFLAHALLPAPHTPVEGVWKLPAGHHLTITADGVQARPRRYWRWTPRPGPVPDSRGEQRLAEELLEILQRAVDCRLVADVPVGVFLSGGIDSSAVAALATRSHGSVETFTVGFTEPSFDESPHASRMATFLNSRHHVEILDLNRALEALPEILDRLDEPQGDASLLPTWLLCRFARRRVTVALGGDGGDELFAGYDPFKALQAAELYRKLVPRPVHSALRLLAGRMPVSHANMSWDFKIKRTLRGLDHPPRLWNPVWLGALEPAELQRLTDGRFSVEEIFSEAIEAWDSCASPHPVDRTLQFFTDLYLQDGILPKADRASMMNSIEVRSPFLDIRVADFAARLPWQLKLRGGCTKYILKRALGPLLPPEIIGRRKKGFGSPTGLWFRSGAIGPEPTSRLVCEKQSAHREGRADERLFLWCETVWQEWEKRRAGRA